MSYFTPSIRCWEDYIRVSQWAKEDPQSFWDSVGRSCLHWRKDWHEVSSWDFNIGKVDWYLGAELNVSENCLDRHVEAGKGDKKALIWVGNEPHEQRIFTFSELTQEVCRVALALESLGIQKGDRVVLYMPNIPELAFSVLACARIGAVHSVIFGGFSASSIHSRVEDCGAKLIITANGCYRGQKWINLKATVDEAMSLGCSSVQKVLVFNRHPQMKYDKKIYDVAWDECVGKITSTHHHAPAHSAQDPLFILYTSGSTGKPKGVMHNMGGYLTYASYTHDIVFQPREEDVYWCTADLGWITGHSYVIYGPLSNGVTTLMYEGVPTHPDAGRFWEIVDAHHVSIFYTAPTAIRILAGSSDEYVKKYSRKSLRVLGSVGEPINPEAWKWFHKTVGDEKSPIVDTWWQTETGGILISAMAGISPTEPGSASFPLPGIEPMILDENGNNVGHSKKGALVIARSWPGQMVGVYGDSQRFYETYFTQYSGYYCTGDAAEQDEQGFFWIRGRTDDVIKVSGHRLGTAEIESACITHPSVMESAAVGVPDALTGEALHVFVVLKEEIQEAESLLSDLKQVVRKEVGPLATPQKIYIVPGLPKTRSGKIMRRILKKLAQGETQNLGDISTLAEPGIVDKLIALAQ